MKFFAILIVLIATLVSAGCANAPGSNGQYATHDRGNGTVDPSAPWFSSTRRY